MGGTTRGHSGNDPRHIGSTTSALVPLHFIRTDTSIPLLQKLLLTLEDCKYQVGVTTA